MAVLLRLHYLRRALLLLVPLEELRRLVDTVLETLFPDITETGDGAVLAMFSRVVESTAELIVR